MYTDSAAAVEFMTFYQLIMNYLKGIKFRTLFGILFILHSIAYAISYYLRRQSGKQLTSQILKSCDKLSLEENKNLIIQSNVEHL